MFLQIIRPGVTLIKLLQLLFSILKQILIKPTSKNRGNMKKTALLLVICMATVLPGSALAIGVEFAAGGWYHGIDGDISYKNNDGFGDNLDVDTLGYAYELRPNMRLKIDMPLLFPNIYLGANMMRFSGSGVKNADFTFGDYTFNQDIGFNSEVVLDNYDACLYYGIPFIKTLTDDMINVDLGINIRVYDFSASVDQPDSGLATSESGVLPLPMLYAGAQFAPIERLSLEAELRGIAYDGNHLYSALGRAKVMIFGPVFGALGYKYEALSIHEDSLDVDLNIGGAFLEAGFEF